LEEEEGKKNKKLTNKGEEEKKEIKKKDKGGDLVTLLLFDLERTVNNPVIARTPEYERLNGERVVVPSHRLAGCIDLQLADVTSQHGFTLRVTSQLLAHPHSNPVTGATHKSNVLPELWYKCLLTRLLCILPVAPKPVPAIGI
jgi:hypothetical protein